jgi:hypothetical protein
MGVFLGLYVAASFQIFCYDDKPSYVNRNGRFVHHDGMGVSLGLDHVVAASGTFSIMITLKRKQTW